MYYYCVPGGTQTLAMLFSVKYHYSFLGIEFEADLPALHCYCQ